ncbi:MAG: PRC-barrel domain-containing protein [Candidatus Nanoarchaeia archaeon]|jgi:sporulation protein YlmC with PRC-barrel domain
MLKLKRISESLGMKVFTNAGDFFGMVEEVEIINNRVYGWKIKPTKDSFLIKVIGGAKGVIVPHKLVDAMGDIMIINKTAVPSGNNDGLDNIAAEN